MPLVLGAGSVGLALAAQLAAAGRAVTLLVRRPAAAAALRAGLVAEDPIAGGERRLRVDATDDLEGALTRGPLEGALTRGPLEAVFVCTRQPDSEAAGRALARYAPDALAVSLQNDLDGGTRLARALPRVVAAVWRQTATRVADDRVRFHGPARVVLGAEPGCATAPEAAALARELSDAGLDAACSERIREDQWLKLCVNLMSAPNALVRPAEHASAAFVELKARLLEEARDALAAARIRAASCDGRDRGLDEEIAFQRASLADGRSARRVPLYNHVWTGLREGRPLEAPAYHRRILELAAHHGVAAPRNARVLEALGLAQREGRGPECFGAEELLGEGSLARSPCAR
jgi:2-dehydropantoate 2-reductase